MNILHNILNRVSVLVVSYSDAHNYSMRLLKCLYRKGRVDNLDIIPVSDLNDIRKELMTYPVILTIDGYGIISKDIASSVEICDKIKTEDSGFIWSEWFGTISFVRKQQLSVLMQSLQQVKAKIVSVRCTQDIENNELFKQNICDTVNRYYCKNIKLKNILTPTAEGSTLAFIVASKIKLPTLGIVMLALIINMTASSAINNKYENMRIELGVLRDKAGQSDEVSRKQQEMMREYSKALPSKASLMCDMIAMRVPEDILLVTLDLQPLIRALEENKKLELVNDQINITGESPSSESVSEYVSALTGLAFTSKVRLVSVEKNRDRDVFEFKLIIDL